MMNKVARRNTKFELESNFNICDRRLSLAMRNMTEMNDRFVLQTERAGGLHETIINVRLLRSIVSPHIAYFSIVVKPGFTNPS